MRTRLVRVRRRPKQLTGAMVFLMLAAVLYIRASLPGQIRLQTEPEETEERVTREAVLEEMEIHLVSFGGYESGQAARVEAARYVSRGAAGYIMEADWHYVIGAGYARQSEAERVCAHLKREEGLACGVISLHAPAVQLRITAGSGRISAFTDAQRLVRTSAVLLGQLSFSIDRGETSVRQALGLIGRQAEQTAAAEQKLRSRQGTADPYMIGAYLKLLADLTERMEEIGLAEGAMELSSRLKHLYIEFSLREIELMNGLG